MTTKVITTPVISAGDILTEAMTSDFASDATDIITGVESQNIAPRTLERYHIDVSDDGPVAGYKWNFQYASSAGYNNTDWAILNHGSTTSEVTWVSPITLEAGDVVRAHIFAHVAGITVSGTTSNVSDDMYFFRLVAETDTGSTVVPGGSWGTSIFVRNSGDTLTTDTPLDTKAFDVLNFRKYRHVDISQLWVVSQASAPITLEKLRWEFKIPSGYHTVYIKEFQVSFYVYKG